MNIDANIEKEMKNLYQKFLHYKYGWKYFSRLFGTLETIFVEFPDFSRLP